MSPELQNKLFEAYPGIFQQRHLGPKHSCMAFGIECGDGWYGIIAALCEGLKDNPNLQACQVKEKYGGLRFYVDGATDVDYELIANAEELSFQVCEICGSSKDVTVTEGWNMTRCAECLKNDK